MPIISPDGKQLFGLDPNSSLFRYEVAGTRLLPGGVGYGQNKRSDAIWVSPDGAYVCVTGVGWSNWQLPEHPPNRAFPAVYVYPVNDLLHPKYTLEHAEPLAAVGFDPREPRIYAADRGSALIVYSTLGPGRHEYVFDQAYFGQGELAGRRQVLVHPDGRKMLLHTGTYFLWIEQPLP